MNEAQQAERCASYCVENSNSENRIQENQNQDTSTHKESNADILRQWSNEKSDIKDANEIIRRNGCMNEVTASIWARECKRE